jgi:hypothetical protein
LFWFINRELFFSRGSIQFLKTENLHSCSNYTLAFRAKRNICLFGEYACFVSLETFLLFIKFLSAKSVHWSSAELVEYILV